MAYTVAEAEVLLLPNAKDFGTTAKAQIVPQAEAIGKEAGDKIGEEIQERVRLALAELPDAKLGLDTSEFDRALDKVLVGSEVKAKVAGKKIGEATGDGMAEGIDGRKALIGAAIAGGVLIGGPVLAAAGIGLMAGLAAVILHSSPLIGVAAAGAGRAFTDDFTAAAAPAVPYFVKALDDIAAAAGGLAQTAAPAFLALEHPIDLVTQGTITLAQNALPGLVDAVQHGTPVFAGLASLLGSIGSGLGSMFTTLSSHSQAMGTDLDALGSALDAVFKALGTILATGADLGTIVLPVLASALQAIAGVLQVLSPILPGLVAGLVAMKVADTLAPMFGTLASSLDTAALKTLYATENLALIAPAGEAAAGGLEAAGLGASTLEAALGPVGIAIAAISLAVPLLMSAFGTQINYQDEVSSSADAMTTALQASKGAIDDNVRATAAVQAQKDGILDYAQTWGVSGATVVDALTGNVDALNLVQTAAGNYADGLRGQASATTDFTTAGAQNVDALRNQAAASDNVLGALQNLASNTQGEVITQQQLQDAINGASSATDNNATRLQALVNVASVANSTISLLKGALDALTGTAVSVDAATVGVTTATNNAISSMTGLTGSLTDDNGQLDLHTQKGAAAFTSLTNLASASNTLISTMEQQGATTSDVTAKDAELRQGFIDTATQMGVSADEANRLADQYYGIPSERTTEITADTAQATAAVAAVQATLAALHDKTLTVRINTTGDGSGLYQSQYQTADGGTTLGAKFQALGGIVHAYADGGMEPMAGGIASIVGPNTLRVIGDRVQDDEAYIPINDSARSQQILATTATRMGYGLAPAGSSGGATDARSYQFNISAPSDPRAIAAQVREAQRDLEFLHG